MTDLLIRDIPDDVLAGIDANARRLGLSRIAYLRRALKREASISDADVTQEDLVRFGQTFADLEDPQVMREAWS